MTILELLCNGMKVKNAGFSEDENIKSWIKLTGSHTVTNVKNQLNDEDSIFAIIKI